MKISTLASVLLMIALTTVAAFGFGHESTIAKASAPTSVEKVTATITADTQLVKFSFESERTVSAVQATTTAEIATEPATVKAIARPAAFVEPGALAYQPDQHPDAWAATALRPPNRSGYNGFPASHAPRAEV